MLENRKWDKSVRERRNRRRNKSRKRPLSPVIISDFASADAIQVPLLGRKGSCILTVFLKIVVTKRRQQSQQGVVSSSECQKACKFCPPRTTTLLHQEIIGRALGAGPLEK